MVQPIQPGELSFPVPCVANPTGLNGVVLYDNVTCPINSVGNQPTSVYGNLGQQQSSESIHNQEVNPLREPSGRLTSGGRLNAPLNHRPGFLSETTHTYSVTTSWWWSQNGPWLVIILTGVILCLTLLLIRNGEWTTFA